MDTWFLFINGDECCCETFLIDRSEKYMVLTCSGKTKIKKYLLTKSYIIGYGQLMNQVYMSICYFIYQVKERSSYANQF